MMRPTIDLLRKFGRLSWRDRLLLVEAAFWLTIASILVTAAFPARQRKEPQETSARIGRDVCRAIVACARWLPWSTGCLQKGIAAQFMLKLRGIPSMLHFGEAPDDGPGLAAHVWTRDLKLDLIDDETDSRCAPLAPFLLPDMLDEQGWRFPGWRQEDLSRKIAGFIDENGGTGPGVQANVARTTGVDLARPELFGPTLRRQRSDCSPRPRSRQRDYALARACVHA
jgi:hypothetical protein